MFYELHFSYINHFLILKNYKENSQVDVFYIFAIQNKTIHLKL